MSHQRFIAALALLVAVFGSLRLDAPRIPDAGRGHAAYGNDSPCSLPWAPARVRGHAQGKCIDYLVGKWQFDGIVVSNSDSSVHGSANGSSVDSGDHL